MLIVTPLATSLTVNIFGVVPVWSLLREEQHHNLQANVQHQLSLFSVLQVSQLVESKYNSVTYDTIYLNSDWQLGDNLKLL